MKTRTSHPVCDVVADADADADAAAVGYNAGVADVNCAWRRSSRALRLWQYLQGQMIFHQQWWRPQWLPPDARHLQSLVEWQLLVLASDCMVRHLQSHPLVD